MDKARRKTDKRLKKMERDMSGVYKKDPALLAVEKEYAAYMKTVQEKTKAEYDAYVHAEDGEKQEKKKEYQDAVKALTLNSTEYRRIVKKVCAVMAKVNQKALNIANDQMIGIYTDNYNQVATECRKVGIKVNG